MGDLGLRAANVANKQLACARLCLIPSEEDVAYMPYNYCMSVNWKNNLVKAK